ncbi:ABC transporter permease [Steroidobacter sp. S1-65]|uniref:ABC transporter permease n=1 Tax=Steroidobacter gossypii TaxID=2805490 RepID=A0ABS1WV22_9GAMM|nr:ABC transporter permease [Steroidobacter gossypii]MBM0104826.1 ABC transporter permease [Steroidobacter gossypii]
MNTRLKAQIVKELLSFLRDPKSRFMLIGPPLMQLLIFSFAATLEVQNVDVAVFNEDNGRGSYELLSQVGAASFVDEIIPVTSTAHLAELVNRRKVLVALHIPADFSRNIAAGRPARAQVLADGRRGNSGQIALSYLSSVITRVGGEASGTGSDPAPLAAVRNWFNPNLTYMWFIVPALGAILTMLIALLVTALSIARERELGTFDQLLVSPATPLEIVIGKMVPALIIGVVLATVMAAAGILLFRVPFSGSYPLLFLSLIVFILSVVGVGLVISSICQTQQQAILGVFAVAVPTILISGFATPVENMPLALQYLAQASPLKHYLIIVHGSFLKALPASEVFANLWPLAVIAAVTLSAAVVIVRRRLQ